MRIIWASKHLVKHIPSAHLRKQRHCELYQWYLTPRFPGAKSFLIYVRCLLYPILTVQLATFQEFGRNYQV